MNGIVIQARMGSSRLPGKTLMDVGGVTLLERLLRRMRMSKMAEQIVVATTVNPLDKAIEDQCSTLGIRCFRGSEEDCLGRMIQASKEAGVEVLCRITADNPLIDPWAIDQGFEMMVSHNLDYLDNIQAEGYPHGGGFEIVRLDALEFSLKTWDEPLNHEHVTWSLRRHLARFRHGIYQSLPEHQRPRYRYSVDRQEDLEVVRAIYAGHDGRDDLRLTEVLGFLDLHPEIRALNEAFAGDIPSLATIRAWQQEPLATEATMICPEGPSNG